MTAPRSPSAARRRTPVAWSPASRSPPTEAPPGTRPAGRRAGPTAGSAHGNPSATIKSRAVDDSGNIETPSAGTAVNVGCTCSIWGTGATPGTSDSGSATAVEVGVKFTSDVSGFVTGIRFYKSAANTGTHVGNLWTASGTKLASATFTGETASGWQPVTFASPVLDQREHDVRGLLLRPGRAHRPGRGVHVPEPLTESGPVQPRRQSSAARAAQHERHGERAVPEQQHEHLPDGQPGRARTTGST